MLISSVRERGSDSDPVMRQVREQLETMLASLAQNGRMAEKVS